jgi:hypothetical protein
MVTDASLHTNIWVNGQNQWGTHPKAKPLQNLDVGHGEAVSTLDKQVFQKINKMYLNVLMQQIVVYWYLAMILQILYIRAKQSYQNWQKIKSWKSHYLLPKLIQKDNIKHLLQWILHLQSKNKWSLKRGCGSRLKFRKSMQHL